MKVKINFCKAFPSSFAPIASNSFFLEALANFEVTFPDNFARANLPQVEAVTPIKIKAKIFCGV